MIPDGVVKVRMDVCSDCEHQCGAFIGGRISHHDPCSSCAYGKWGRYSRACDEISGIGLGDIVERIAKPIAKALHMKCLDENNKLRPESPCAKRRDKLNKIRIG
jgi:hypothetical protein